MAVVELRRGYCAAGTWHQSVPTGLPVAPNHDDGNDNRESKVRSRSGGRTRGAYNPNGRISSNGEEYLRIKQLGTGDIPFLLPLATVWQVMQSVNVMGNPKGRDNVRKRAARRRKTERLAMARKKQKSAR
jgi:hypothetical protein